MNTPDRDFVFECSDSLSIAAVCLVIDSILCCSPNIHKRLESELTFLPTTGLLHRVFVRWMAEESGGKWWWRKGSANTWNEIQLYVSNNYICPTLKLTFESKSLNSPAPLNSINFRVREEKKCFQLLDNVPSLARQWRPKPLRQQLAHTFHHSTATWSL